VAEREIRTHTHMSTDETSGDILGWLPRAFPAGVPQYLAIVDSIEEGLRNGRLRPGVRLPPRRTLAKEIGVSLGTITRAYEEAQNRGLVDAQVGRGTYLNAVPSPAGTTIRGQSVDLSLNVSPSVGEDRVIRRYLRQLADAPSIAEMASYLPHFGMERHRADLSAWLAANGVELPASMLALCCGAQHGIWIAARAAAVRDTPIITEAATYSGFRALASLEGYTLAGAGLDEHGVRPDEVDRLARETGARLVYLTPTLQSPTTSVMPLGRREEIVAVARAHDLTVIEDDAYGMLLPDAPPPLATLAPERVFYVTGLSKYLSPMMRLGLLHVPARFRDVAATALRTTTWMAPPLHAELVARMIRDGALEEVVAAKRAEASVRLTEARRILQLDAAGGPAVSYHLWMPASDRQSAASLAADASARGIVMAHPDALEVSADAPPGLRLCLGGPATREALYNAVSIVAHLRNAGSTRFVI